MLSWLGAVLLEKKYRNKGSPSSWWTGLYQLRDGDKSNRSGVWGAIMVITATICWTYTTCAWLNATYFICTMLTDGHCHQLKGQQESPIGGAVKKEMLFRANSSTVQQCSHENSRAVGQLSCDTAGLWNQQSYRTALRPGGPRGNRPLSI